MSDPDSDYLITTGSTGSNTANPPTGAANGGPGLVTSAIASRVFATRLFPSENPMAPEPGTDIGRGFPGTELVRHVRDSFGPDAEPRPVNHMAPNRAAAAAWDGGESVEWTLYLTPGAVRIGSHDPVARERRYLTEIRRRDQDVRELLRVAKFLEAVSEVIELREFGVGVDAELLAAAWMHDPDWSRDDTLFWLEAPTDEATRANWVDWARTVVEMATKYPDGALPGTTKRGRIFGLSRKARARMIYTLASLDMTALIKQAPGGVVPMDTLTYGADWLSACPSGEAFHKHMDTFWRAHERAWGRWGKEVRYVDAQDRLADPQARKRIAQGDPVPADLRAVTKKVWKPTPIRCIWKLEFQHRGAPHGHILKASPSGRARVPDRGRRPVGAGCTYRAWLSATWNFIVYGSRACEGWAPGDRCLEPLRAVLDDDGRPVMEGPDENRQPVVTGCPGGHETRRAVVERHWAANPDLTRAQAEDAIDEQAANHLKAGTNVSVDDTMSITDPKRLAAYFAKHGSFQAKRYQDKAPAEWGVQDVADDGGLPDAWRAAAEHTEDLVDETGDPLLGLDGEIRQSGNPGTGRIWGYKGLKKVETPIRVTAEEAIRLGRYLRKYTRSMDSIRPIDDEDTGQRVHVARSPLVDKPADPETGRPDRTWKNRQRRNRVLKGKHSAPRLSGRTVARFRLGRVAGPYSVGTPDVIGLAGLDRVGIGPRNSSEGPSLPTLRTVRRRAARFANSGTPSGWALVLDGERVGSMLARALGQGGHVSLGLHDGLALAAPIDTGPAPTTRWSRTDNATVDRLLDDTDWSRVDTTRLGPELRARIQARRDRDDTGQAPTVSATTAPTVAARPVCSACGGHLADAVLAAGTHLLCAPPLIPRPAPADRGAPDPVVTTTGSDV